MDRFHGNSFKTVGLKVTAVITCRVIIAAKKKKSSKENI